MFNYWLDERWCDRWLNEAVESKKLKLTCVQVRGCTLTLALITITHAPDIALFQCDQQEMCKEDKHNSLAEYDITVIMLADVTIRHVYGGGDWPHISREGEETRPVNHEAFQSLRFAPDFSFKNMRYSSRENSSVFIVGKGQSREEWRTYTW